MNKLPEQHAAHELRAKRKELHGKRRELHERLSDVCEEFVTGPLTKEHKQKVLVRELRYLLDYYQDEEILEGHRVNGPLHNGPRHGRAGCR